MELRSIDFQRINGILSELEKKYVARIQQFPAKDARGGEACKVVATVLRSGTDAPIEERWRLLKSELRSALEELSWFSTVCDDEKCRVLLSPKELVSVEVLFHATMHTRWPQIHRLGLLPSDDKISSTGRPDCYGRIYGTTILGDLEPIALGTAHWWRYELARSTNRIPSDYCVLSVNAAGMKIYRDPISTTGLIVDHPIEAARIIKAFPADDCIT